MGSARWIVLNSSRVVHEIINKRAAITSERPEFPVIGGLVSRNKRTVLRQTKHWQDGRRVMQHLLNGTNVRSYGPILESESLHLLVNYLQQPGQWYRHNYRYAYFVIHRIVAGERSGHTPEQLGNFQRITVEFIRSINVSLVDFFPFLARLPTHLQLWRPRWRAIGQDHFNVLSSWWVPVSKTISEGAPPSFIQDVLLRNKRFSEDEEEAIYLATSIVAAGSDNVRMTINTFIMAAISHPEVMQKARKEIDNICGENAERLPSLLDIGHLRYVLALVKEVLRWRPTVPLIPQHRLTEAFDFEGYHFPAGVDFVINSPSVCGEGADAKAFKPDRWLDGTEDNIVAGLWQFGGGRRVCVGYKLAQQELFLAYSRLLYCFDFEAVSQCCEEMVYRMWRADGLIERIV